MVDYAWNGSVDSSSTTAANWTPSGVPGSSDSVIFESGASNPCIWTQAFITNFSQTASNEVVTINIPILTVSGTFTHQGTIGVHPSQTTLIIRLTGTNPTLYRFGAKTVTSWADDSKAKTTIEYKGVGTYHILDNGEYPTLKIFGNVSPHPPTSTESTFDEVDIATLTFDSTGYFEEISALVFKSNAFEERKRVFRVRSIGTWSSLKHESGKGTWIYYATTSGFELPMTGSNIAGTSNFVAKTGQIRVTSTSTGNKIKIPPGPHFLEKLTIDTGVICICDRGGAELRMTNRPKIDGAWQFVQVSDGIYVSSKEDITLPITHGGTGETTAQNAINSISSVSTATNEHVLTKDTTTGDAIWKAAAASTPGPTGPAGPQGPAGPAGAAGADGNTIDISALTANTAIADADLLLLDDGANGTNRKITFTEVKEWIRGEGIKHGTNSRDGGVNELRIRDSRDDGDVHPNDFPSKAVSFDFTDDITGSPNTWDSVMTLKGWSNNYRAWQIFSSSGSGSQSVDEVPLFFRSGEEDVQDGWGQLKEILTFPGTAPRTDGAADQVLQTDGAGVLSWASLPTPPITGQYQRFVLQDSIGSPTAISAGTTTQLTFGTSGKTLVAQYAVPTDFVVPPTNTHIDIVTAGLYQFTLCGFIAGISGSNPDYRLTISSTPSLTGDILSFRNRTQTVDRYTGSGVATVYLAAGSTVYFSVFCGGRSYEVGGVLSPPVPGETRTFLDVRRVE